MNGQHNKKEGILFRHLLFYIFGHLIFHVIKRLVNEKNRCCFRFI